MWRYRAGRHGLHTEGGDGAADSQKSRLSGEQRSPDRGSKESACALESSGSPNRPPGVRGVPAETAAGHGELARKFDFPNDYSVYLHGTPAHQLFSRARRDFSHGCIRVEDPQSLAEWVLRDNPDWSRKKIAADCNGDATMRIPLRKPIAVLVLYGTAVVEESGEVRFFDDIYGYDAELRRALAARKRASTDSER